MRFRHILISHSIVVCKLDHTVFVVAGIPAVEVPVEFLVDEYSEIKLMHTLQFYNDHIRLLISAGGLR